MKVFGDRLPMYLKYKCNRRKEKNDLLDKLNR